MKCKTPGCNNNTPLMFQGYADFCDTCHEQSAERSPGETTKPLFEQWWADLTVGDGYRVEGLTLYIKDIRRRCGDVEEVRISGLWFDKDQVARDWEDHKPTPIPRASSHTAAVALGTSGSSQKLRTQSYLGLWKKAYPQQAIEKLASAPNPGHGDRDSRKPQEPEAAPPGTSSKPSQQCCLDCDRPVVAGQVYCLTCYYC